MTAVDEIKQRADIVDVISRYTPLKKAGSTYKGNCPFHDERTPSFVVFPHSGTWHCFGACGTGGDVFTFLMQKENLEFRETLEMLARETGVELEQPDADSSHQQRNALYTINAAAAAYFRETLENHPAASEARGYLERRQIDHDTAEHFQLGYALDSWDALRDHLRGLGYAIEDQLAAGLIKHNQARSSTYDAFRGRVIIPIRDRQKRVIGFGGRALGDGIPKYLNTAETPVFHKSHVVYAIDLAYRAINDQEQVVIVEGYMDVIAAHQHGFENVVACMGTALTPEQLRQLQRFTKDYVLALDADAAGQQATIRGLNQARQALDRVRKPTVIGGRMRFTDHLAANLSILSMPEGQDPDDVIRNDPAHWTRLIDEAKPLVDYYIQVVGEQVDLTSAQGKAAAVAELAPLIAELGDEIERQHYTQQLSRLVQIDERTVAGRVTAAAKTIQATGSARPAEQQRSRQRSVQRPNRGSSSSPPPLERDLDAAPESPPPGSAPLPEPPPESWEYADEFIDSWPAEDSGADFGQPDVDQPEVSASSSGQRPVERPAPEPQTSPHPPSALTHEDHLLAVLLQSPDLLIWLAQVSEREKVKMDLLHERDFEQTENREIFRTLKGFIVRDEPWDIEALQDELDEQLHGHLARLMAYTASLPTMGPIMQQEDLVKSFLRLRLKQIRSKSNQIRFLQDDAHRSNEREAMRSYDILNNQHLRDLRHLQYLLKHPQEIVFDRGRQDGGVTVRY